MGARTVDDIECHFPSSLDEALELLSDEQARGTPMAGCTDLMVGWASGGVNVPERAIDVSRLAELKVIDERDDHIVVGAGVTFMEMRQSSIVPRWAPALVEAAATVGGYQIQTMGTLAGSMVNASPAGDPAPTLLVTDGTVVLASHQGEREVPLESFWTGYREIDRRPDELVVRVELPKLTEGARETFRKLGPRGAQAISKVMGAYRGQLSNDGTIDDFRVSLGSVAPTAIRLYELEAWLQGKELTPDLIDGAESRASQEVEPIDDIRSTARYRQWVSGRLVRGFLNDLTNPA